MRIIFFLLLIISSTVLGQVVYEPLHRDVYQYLSRLSQKGIIELDDQIKPLSRTYIASKLNELKDRSTLLTPLETDELNFYLSDFDREIKFVNSEKYLSNKSAILATDNADRFRLFTYTDNVFSLNISPILGLKIGRRDDSQLTHIWNGVYAYGYLTENIGFSFDFRDNMEKGTSVDKFKSFTPTTGVNARSDANIVNYSSDKIEYSEAKAVLSYSWDWGSLSVGKEFFEWGYGEGGKLVLSPKAPSFPFIRLDANPVSWLSFNYIHAWLSSDIIDSTDFYFTDLGQIRFNFREKFLAAHSLSIKPIKGLNISIGESIIYSDKPEFLYLMPIMFYRLADHYLSRHYNAAGSNAQFFGSISSRNHIPNTHLYGTLFIDEITMANLFDSEKQRNQVGLTLGGSIVDLPVDNLTFTLEYTKIYPFVYEHYIPTTTYRSASYNLGHWMGHNADQIYTSVEYRLLRGLKAKLWGQYIRKGEEGEPIQQHIQPQPPFLFGYRKNYTYFGGFIKYELLHEFFGKVEFQTTKSSVQQADNSFIDKTLSEFYFSVYYGL